MKVVRHPLAHFVALGALLFGASKLTDDGRALGLGVDPIVVDAERVERLRNEWTRETRRVPTTAELEAMVRRHADEEILVREALRLGVDREDPIVYRRLVRNVRFLRGESDEKPRTDDDAAFEEALALGLNHRDLVVRRRLREALQERLVRNVSVSEQEVRAHVEANPGRYSVAERISFEQLFLDADRRRGTLLQDVVSMQSALAAGASVEGDPFLEGSRFGLRREEDLSRSFGAEFAKRAMAAPLERWSEPIESSWGVHFIRVTERRGSEPAPFEKVRRRAYYALLAEREQQVVDTALQRLRKRYPMQVGATLVARR